MKKTMISFVIALSLLCNAFSLLSSAEGSTTYITPYYVSDGNII